MFAFLIRWAFRALALSGLLYVTFFVDLGAHTLYEHARRIAATDEARELGGELDAVVDDARHSVARGTADLGGRFRD